MLSLHAEAQQQAEAGQVPRLVVNIIIDQLRSDYLEFFEPTYGEEGFKKLLAEGMVFEHGSYPFDDIDRASAISSVFTATSPFYHEITGEQWIDRETLRRIYCTDSPTQSSAPSPRHLAVSTIGDELKIATEGKAKVYAIAPTSDAAILSAGHAADGAFWADVQNKGWKGSQYYSNFSPAWLLNFNQLSKKSKRKKKQQEQWLLQLNNNVTELARQCIANEALGQDTIPDMLCLTYDAGKNNQFAYHQIDEAIGSLISHVESTIGSGNTLYVVTSTGYHQTQPADYERYHIPTGTFYINRAANLLNMYFGALWGQGKYVDACFKNQIYLNHQLLESKRISLADAHQRAQEFILQMAGAKRVTGSIYEKHKGDLQVEVAPGWHLQNEDTHEDQQIQWAAHSFPIIIYRKGTPSRKVETPVSIERIAPTIAKAIRIRAPNACLSEPLF